MRNRRAVGLAVTSSFMLCIAMIACSSDNDGSTFTNNGADASFDGGTSIAPPDANQSTPDATVNCQPTLPTTFAPTWTPPTVAQACSSTDIEGYYDSCIAADSMGKSQFNTKTCTDWLAEHGGDASDSCAGCIERADNSGPIQVYRDRFYYTLNNAGCIAIEQNKLDATSCGAAYDGTTSCARAACDPCFDIQGVQFTDFTKCEGAATTSSCTQYKTKSDTACAGYKDLDGGVPQCFQELPDGGPEDQPTYYRQFLGFFCGKP